MQKASLGEAWQVMILGKKGRRHQGGGRCRRQKQIASGGGEAFWSSG